MQLGRMFRAAYDRIPAITLEGTIFRSQDCKNKRQYDIVNETMAKYGRRYNALRQETIYKAVLFCQVNIPKEIIKLVLSFLHE